MKECYVFSYPPPRSPSSSSSTMCWDMADYVTCTTCIPSPLIVNWVYCYLHAWVLCSWGTLYVQFKHAVLHIIGLHNGTAFILLLTLCSLHYIHMLVVSNLVTLYCYIVILLRITVAAFVSAFPFPPHNLMNFHMRHVNKATVGVKYLLQPWILHTPSFVAHVMNDIKYMIWDTLGTFSSTVNFFQALLTCSP